MSSPRAIVLRAVWIALAMLSAAVASFASFAATAASPVLDPSLDRKLKASFIHQFIPYVEWPRLNAATPEGAIVIAVVGDTAAVQDFADVLDRRSIDGRQIVVRRWHDGPSQPDVHIVFVTDAERARLPAVVRATQSSATLIVTESEGALRQGSMINFRRVDGKVRFDVALAPVDKAGLRISSRLLVVAREVRTAKPAP